MADSEMRLAILPSTYSNFFRTDRFSLCRSFKRIGVVDVATSRTDDYT